MDAKVRDLLTKVKNSAMGAGRSAGKAASDLMNQAKRNIRIVELNSEIESAYKNLGKMLYAVHNGVEIPADSIDETLMNIDAKKEEIDSLRETIQRSKADSVCPVCGKFVGKKAAFCSACGAKIKRDAADACDCCCEVKDAEEHEDCVAEAEACVEEAEKVFKDACEEAGETAGEAVESVQEAAETVRDTAEDVFENVVDTFKNEDNQ